jgi:hypothetical protein
MEDWEDISMLVESDGSGLFETPTANSSADGEEKGGKGCGQNGSELDSRFIAGAESAQSFDDPSNLEMLSGIFNTPHPFPTLESAVFHALEHSKVHADAARAAGEEPPAILTEEQAKVELVLCLDFADKFLQGDLPSYKGTMSELKFVYSDALIIIIIIIIITLLYYYYYYYCCCCCYYYHSMIMIFIIIIIVLKIIIKYYYLLFNHIITSYSCYFSSITTNKYKFDNIYFPNRSSYIVHVRSNT